jgi:hypothetical protein
MVNNVQDLRILNLDHFTNMVSSKEYNVLIIDFYFSFKMLTLGNKDVPEIYTEDILSIIDNLNIKRVEFVLDDNLFKEFNREFIHPIREHCKSHGVKGLIAEVPKKVNYFPNGQREESQRADSVLASRIGFYMPLVDNIILFTGDADFIPAIRLLLRTGEQISKELGCKSVKRIFALYLSQASYKEEFLKLFGGKNEFDLLNQRLFFLSLTSITNRDYGFSGAEIIW